MKVFLTGSSGFIGSNLLSGLVSSSYDVIKSSRNLKPDDKNQDERFFNLEDINTINEELFHGCDIVIHTAGLAHTKEDQALYSDSKFREINELGTKNLAVAASDAGVKRFIFLSSIGVNGVTSDKPFKADSIPNPIEHYAVSKLAAEKVLFEIAANSNMDVVIIRPPLVYGPNAPGNFGKLLKLARKDLPLPLGATNNKRSLIGIDNLVNLIVTCIEHPMAANQVFLASDDHDVSTDELLKEMRKAAGKNIRLIQFPVPLLRLLATIFGKKAIFDRLFGSLQVDISRTKELLDWKPPVSFEEGIKRCLGTYMLKRDN